MAEPETLRLLLEKTIERNDGLVKINHEVTIAIPTILAAVWGISLKENGISMIPVLCIISIGLLIVWRYFAHNVDDDIAKNYSRILQIEKNLMISRECSIFNGLIISIISPIKGEFKDEIKRDEEFKRYEKSVLDLCKDQRIKLVQLLYDNKKMGCRGHDIWDIVGFFLILYCTTYLGYFLLFFRKVEYITSLLKNLGFDLSLVIIIVLNLLIVGGCLVFYERIIKKLNFQVHPTKEEMDGFITKAKILALITEEDC